MQQQGLSSQRMQDFGKRGLHALSHAGSENNDIHRQTVEVRQNFIMRPYRNLATRLILFLLVGLLTACSLARLGYRNGETVSYYWLDSYVNFDSDQQSWVKKEIDAWFDWQHRAQLPPLVQFLKHAQKAVQSPVTEAQVQADYDEIKKRFVTLIEHAIPPLADLALSLYPDQIRNIEKKFASNNDKFRKKYLRGDIEERQELRYKEVLKQAKHWFGHFSEEQESAIRAASDARPLNNELLLAARMQRQAAMIAMLKKIQAEKPPRETVMAMLRGFLKASMDYHGNPEHKRFFEEYSAANVKMTTLIINISTPAQKEDFIHTVQQWINDFNALAE
jgi:hypothetical protein